MSSAYVRRADLRDTPTVAALRQAWAEEQAGRMIDDPDFHESVAGWIRREQSHRITWLVEPEGRAAGMLSMLVFTRMPRPRALDVPDRATQWGYVANVYVAASHRVQGLGAQLLDAATSYADGQGFARVVLNPSELSRSLYERAGFGPATTLMVRTLDR